MTFMLASIFIIIAYLFGSISSAIIVCKIMQLPDPRTQGSKNPGATNVLRVGGKLPAAITLLGDVLKGFIPVFLVKFLGASNAVIAITAFAAFLGHLFPIFFRFEGGKGVATLLGCLLALSWQVALCWGITWLIIAILFRYSSLASLVASLLTPFFIYYFTNNQAFTIGIVCMLPLLVIRHRTNIAKLRAGTEQKII